MILQSALLLFATSAFQVATPDPATVSVLPPDCGLTEEQVLDLALPGVQARLKKSKAHEKDELNELLFGVTLVDALVTDFGLGKGKFLVVVLEIRDGYCNFCLTAEMVAIDLKRGTVVRHYPPEDARARSIQDGRSLRLFRLFPDETTNILAFSYASPNCDSCGGGGVDEQWLLPRWEPGGSLTLTPVWHGMLKFWHSGNRGGTRSEGCAAIRSLWPRRSYRYEQHNFAGWPDWAQGRINPFQPVEGCGENQIEFSAAVDFVATQDFDWNPVERSFSSTEVRWTRTDLHAALTWPFNLPVRALIFPWEVTAEPAGGESRHCLPSPMGDVCVGRAELRGSLEPGVQICRLSDSTVLRMIPDPNWLDDSKRENEYFGYGCRSIGWNADGQRALVVMDLGYLNLPPVLLSLTPDGRGGKWEGFLPRGFRLGDGFILDLPEPTLTSDGAPTGHR